MVEIDTTKEIAKYQAEYNQFVSQLQTLQQQLAQVTQAIAERRGILIFLNSLNQNPPEK
jgi:prefoldin subunit 5